MSVRSTPARPLVVPAPVRARIEPEHAARIAAELALLPRPSEDALPATGLLLLCFTNRCGSGYLAGLLGTTGAINEAGEFFNADTVLEHSRRHGLASLRAYLALLPRLAGAPAAPHGQGGWLAAKAGIDQLMMLTDSGILDEMHGRLRFVLLERRDRLGQAVSRCIAAQNGRWTSAQAARVADHALVYDRGCIEAELARIALANAAFYSFFAANGLAPLHLAHEDVLADPAGEVARVSALLGIPAARPDPARVALRRQAGLVNAEWRTRYLAGL